jgi:hypothetical protein
MTYPTPQASYGIANGSSPTSPFLPVFSIRAPLVTDTAYPISKRWVLTTSGAEWVLVGFSPVNGVLQANWEQISRGALATIATLTGTDSVAVGPSSAGNINFAGSGITITNTGANTLTFTSTATGNVISVSGTTNQITSSPTTGAVVVSLPTIIIAPGSLMTTTSLSSGTTATIGTGLTVTSGGATITSGGLNVVAGGAAITGTTNIEGTATINTTDTANTTIGNSTGTTGLIFTGGANLNSLVYNATWTPTFNTGFVGTYVANYSKIGRFVFFNLSIQQTSNSGSGNFSVGNMPFPVDTSSLAIWSINVEISGFAWPASVTFANGIFAGPTTLEIQGYYSNAPLNALPVFQITSGAAQYVFQGFYVATS